MLLDNHIPTLVRVMNYPYFWKHFLNIYIPYPSNFLLLKYEINNYHKIIYIIFGFSLVQLSLSSIYTSSEILKSPFTAIFSELKGKLLSRNLFEFRENRSERLFQELVRDIEPFTNCLCSMLSSVIFILQ